MQSHIKYGLNCHELFYPDQFFLPINAALRALIQMKSSLIILIQYEAEQLLIVFISSFRCTELFVIIDVALVTKCIIDSLPKELK